MHGHLGCLMGQVALLEEQKNEAAEDEDAEKVEDEAKPIDIDSSPAEPTRKSDALDDKPDINDVPAEESQVKFYLFFSAGPKKTRFFSYSSESLEEWLSG